MAEENRVIHRLLFDAEKRNAELIWELAEIRNIEEGNRNFRKLFFDGEKERRKLISESYEIKAENRELIEKNDELEKRNRELEKNDKLEKKYRISKENILFHDANLIEKNKKLEEKVETFSLIISFWKGKYERSKEKNGELKQKNEELNRLLNNIKKKNKLSNKKCEQNNCIICMNRAAKYLSISCNHKLYCINCFRNNIDSIAEIKNCPICRKRIEEISI